MRVTLAILLFCSAWIYGGEHICTTNVQHLPMEFSLLQKQAFAKQYDLGESFQNDKLIEDSEIENLEESHCPNSYSNNLPNPNNKFYNSGFLKLSVTDQSKNDSKGAKNFQPFFGYSQPIYISQRVLRI